MVFCIWITMKKGIKEVAQLLNIEQSVLRFWESQFEHISPDKHNSRRVYSKQDIEQLTEIHHLLYEKGYTLKGAKKYLSQNDKSPLPLDQSEPYLQNILHRLEMLHSKLMETLE